MSILWFVFSGNVWPHNPSRHYSIPIDFIAVSSSPAGNAASVGFTSRDAHRAMFPSPRQENFYSLKGQRNTSVRLPKVNSASCENLQNKPAAACKNILSAVAKVGGLEECNK